MAISLFRRLEGCAFQAARMRLGDVPQRGKAEPFHRASGEAAGQDLAAIA
jgi:hypothetical protein